ncbi:DUF927 domain-containing protein [Methylobacterium nodulans]|uniref:DUF927 domain-containing protein n=1 Tax=Methylobacterium nodulans TaxID=114616 RepID=UPI000161928B|nr:DUF927 domain-containing protein [Methylobacterium nodulans]
MLALDELGHVSGKELSRIIYGLASGAGKLRMAADGSIRKTRSWSTFVLLSSEKSIEERIRADGGEAPGGVAVRIADVDVSSVNRMVDQRTLAEINGINQHFGHAGPAFVEAMVAEGLHRQASELREGINRTAAAIAGPGADGMRVRAALPFAILSTAGTLAKSFGILPDSLDVGRVIRWAWDRFQGSPDATALDPEERAIESLRHWIAEKWGSGIHPTDPGSAGDVVKNWSRDAIAWFDDHMIYIPATRIVEACGGGLKEIEIGRALDQRGLIAKRKARDCFFTNFVPRVGRLKAYALPRSEFRSKSREEPALAVIDGRRQ